MFIFFNKKIRVLINSVSTLMFYDFLVNFYLRLIFAQKDPQGKEK